MNRLSPLILRGPPSSAAALALPGPSLPEAAGAADRPGADDLRLFATSFLSGLVFFGTYLA